MGRRYPRSISHGVQSILDDVAPQTTLGKMQLAWPEAAGEAIAVVSRVVSEDDGVVTIACASGTWAEQLDLLQSRLLESLREASGSGDELRGLRFKVGLEPIPGD